MDEQLTNRFVRWLQTVLAIICAALLGYYAAEAEIGGVILYELLLIVNFLGVTFNLLKLEERGKTR